MEGILSLVKHDTNVSGYRVIKLIILAFPFFFFLATVPGSLSWRARNVLMGSVLGAAFGFPLGKCYGP